MYPVQHRYDDSDGRVDLFCYRSDGNACVLQLNGCYVSAILVGELPEKLPNDIVLTSVVSFRPYESTGWTSAQLVGTKVCAKAWSSICRLQDQHDVRTFREVRPDDAAGSYLRERDLRLFAWWRLTGSQRRGSTSFRVPLFTCRRAELVVREAPDPPIIPHACFDIETDMLHPDKRIVTAVVHIEDRYGSRSLGWICDDVLREPLPPGLSDGWFERVPDEAAAIRACAAALSGCFWVTGWNMLGFDMRVLFERAKALGLGGKVDARAGRYTSRVFAALGCMRVPEVTLRRSTHPLGSTLVH